MAAYGAVPDQSVSLETGDFCFGVIEECSPGIDTGSGLSSSAGSVGWPKLGAGGLTRPNPHEIHAEVIHAGPGTAVPCPECGSPARNRGEAQGIGGSCACSPRSDPRRIGSGTARCPKTGVFGLALHHSQILDVGRRPCFLQASHFDRIEPQKGPLPPNPAEWTVHR